MDWRHSQWGLNQISVHGQKKPEKRYVSLQQNQLQFAVIFSDIGGNRDTPSPRRRTGRDFYRRLNFHHIGSSQ